ncbi:MAG TPA: DUF1598 domain-containing protein [Pirellulaceae bacterium]|nr:DUF1598 domain-containing protein [Pirellulaceae bacterium]
MTRTCCVQCGGRALAAAAILAFFPVVTFLASDALAGDAADKVQAHLEAGEFGPAKAAAAAIGDAAARDRAFADIAAAQAGAGARRASLHSLHDISGDLSRSEALSRVARQPGFFGGARGGGVIADFDSLIDLITTTISPDSWDEVGGPGSIDSFEGGVFVDPTGLLRRLPPETDRSLVVVRQAAALATHTTDPRRKSILRKISLQRLEREVQMLHALGRDPDEAMQTLAGLKRIKYILVYPETGDIVLAGPAGDWRRDAEGRFVEADSSQPVVNLDDLVVTLRNAYGDLGRFGCSITPRRENLAAAQEINDRWSKQPLKPSQREKWLSEFRDAVGRQDIEIYGIDPRTRTGRVIVEADYRMKLVGLGLEEGTLGVTSYLDSIPVSADGKAPPMSVLRWWFTLNYAALSATEDRNAFELKGPGVKVQSENELLTERGERVHTGKSDELNQQFAESFTNHFEQLAAKYSIYADLRNIFDLSLVAAVIHSHDLPGQTNWHMTHFGAEGAYEPELGFAPAAVESIMNHKLVGGKHIIAAVSGGVTVDARELAARQAVKTDGYGLLKTERSGAAPQNLPRGAWWWD